MSNIYDINTKQQINTDTQHAKRLADSVEGMGTFTFNDFRAAQALYNHNLKSMAVFNTSGLSLGGIEKKDDE